MARQLKNVSGTTLALQDSHGRWQAVEPDQIFTVDDRDQRYYQTGEQGEDPLFEEMPTRKTRTKTTTDEEAS